MVSRASRISVVRPLSSNIMTMLRVKTWVITPVMSRSLMRPDKGPRMRPNIIINMDSGIPVLSKSMCPVTAIMTVNPIMVKTLKYM